MNLRNSPCNSPLKGNQNKMIIQFLKLTEASRYMISKELNIPVQSVCYRVDDLIKKGLIQIVKIEKCKVSGRWVQFLTSDPKKFRNENENLAIVQWLD